MQKRLAASLLAAIATLILSACGDRGGAPAPAPAAADGEALRPAEPKGLSPTLRKVRQRGRLNCGVAGDAPGFSTRDDKGAWSGFDVDFCRAVAAAVLGDARAVNFTVLDQRSRFAALQSGVVDLVARNTAWTFSRDAAQGVDFVGVSYYDSEGFLAASSLDIEGGFGGKRVCVTAGSTSQLTLADWFRSRNLEYTPVPADSEGEALGFFERGACDLLTGTRSALAAAQMQLDQPDNYLILPEVLSKEPVGPMVREGDAGWTDVVQWTLFALILADEFQLTSDTVDEARRNNRDPEVRRFLGVEGSYGSLLSLRKDWAFLVIQRVGSYGQVFDRNLGAGSPLKLERGLNTAWNAEPAGLLYSPPMR
jgi:general L-amino acid transport system substrate-binding protein